MSNAKVPLAASVALLAVHASANLLQNGGFENNTYAPNYVFYVPLSTGQTVVPNWSVAGTPYATVDLVGSWVARTGSYAIDLAGTPGPGRIQQSFATNPGSTISISFWIYSNNTASSNDTVVADLNGTTQTFTVANLGVWERFTITAFAPTASSTFMVGTTLNNGTNGNLVIDDIEAVPEPASLSVLTVGTLALLRRRSA